MFSVCFLASQGTLNGCVRRALHRLPSAWRPKRTCRKELLARGTSAQHLMAPSTLRSHNAVPYVCLPLQWICWRV
jgi:hypothetical protein